MMTPIRTVPVRVVSVDARTIFNLASPRLLPDLSRHWMGKRPWFDPRYDPIRDFCEAEYIRRFNQVTGHYARLEESIARDGFRNPVMLSAGRLTRRALLEVPPSVDIGRTLFCEYVGGSRVTVAVKLGIAVPAVVNDFANMFPTARQIATGDTASLLALFKDKPRSLHWRHDGGVYANYLPYSHYPNTVTTGEQIAIRRGIVNAILDSVQQWMAQHDHD